MAIIRISTSKEGVLELISKVEGEGFATPDAIALTISGVHALPNTREVEEQAHADLLAAVRAGGADEIRARTLAAALTQAVDANGHSVLNVVVQNARLATMPAIISEYPFEAAFVHVAEIYNEVATSMHAAIDTVDPQANPQTIDEGQLVAWQSVPALARRLEELKGLLISLYEASPFAVGQVRVSRWEVGMCATPPADVDKHAQTILAWSTNSRAVRGGRFAAIVALGSTLRAPATIQEYEPWPEFKQGRPTGMR